MTLHPQSQAFLDERAKEGAPAWQDMPLDDARQIFDNLPFFGEVLDLAEVTDSEIAGVPVRIYKPSTEGTLDVIVFFHGGGWVLGGIESHDALCRRVAEYSGAAVVSVEYRKPPEDPFPAAVEDCFTVCDVLSMDHASFGFSKKMVVAGDSAGGNLSAAVSLMAAQRGGPEIAGQVLIYPVLDGSLSGESYEQLATGYGLTRDTMAWFWDQYTGSMESAARTNPLASPANAEELSGLPATHMLTVEYDVLRTECETFAQKLRDAGVKVSTQHCDGMLHGFIHFAGPFDDAIPATREVAEKCRELLDQSP